MYVTDSIFYYNQNKALQERYYDLIHQTHVEDERSGDEIALDIITRLKGD